MDFSDSSVRAKQLQPRDREFGSPTECPQCCDPEGLRREEEEQEEGQRPEGSAVGGRVKKMSNVLEHLKNKTKKKTQKKNLEFISVAIIKSRLAKFSSLL